MSPLWLSESSVQAGAACSASPFGAGRAPRRLPGLSLLRHSRHASGGCGAGCTPIVVSAPVARRIEALAPKWINTMHGATITGEALPYYTDALLTQEFAYRGELFGRPIGDRAAPGS